jgi:cell wall-associated NlpC family hydrolase
MKQHEVAAGGPARPTSVRGVFRRIAILSLAVSLLVPGIAAAAPKPSISQMRADAQAARDRIEDLAAQFEVRSEEYFAVQQELEDTRQKIRVAEGDLEVAEAEVAAAKSQLNNRAGSIYRDGPVDVLSVFLGVTDFKDFVTRMDLLRRIGRNDAVIVARVKQAKADVEKTRSDLESRRLEQSTLLQTASVKRSEVNQLLQAQKEYLAGIDEQLKKAIAEEQARRERIARERAAQAAAQLAAAQAARGGSPSPARAFDPANMPPSRSSVVGIARAFIGKTPYVWGGTTPVGFDCSGLTLYCYAQVGVALPRTSRGQFTVGAYIPPDRLDVLAPGDLVFFGTDGSPDMVHHVGIYSGDGNFIHAPYTGALVSESSLLERIASRGDYVGATRP